MFPRLDTLDPVSRSVGAIDRCLREVGMHTKLNGGGRRTNVWFGREEGREGDTPKPPSNPQISGEGEGGRERGGRGRKRQRKQQLRPNLSLVGGILKEEGSDTLNPLLLLLLL